MKLKNFYVLRVARSPGQQPWPCVPSAQAPRVRVHGQPSMIWRIVGVCSVLDVQYGVLEAHLPERRVAWLRLRHAAQFHKQHNRCIINQNSIRGCNFCQLTGCMNRRSYLVASPSWFPPSPKIGLRQGSTSHLQCCMRQLVSYTAIREEGSVSGVKD
jgi:hypothetical protein